VQLREAGRQRKSTFANLKKSKEKHREKKPPSVSRKKGSLKQLQKEMDELTQ
jgi:hypothetical protein